LSKLDVSIIIAAKNESAVIDSCLKSIYNQSLKPIEVILVDGRSTDDTVEKAQKYPAKIIIESGKPSPSNARNQGVENATGDIVLILDADTELDVDCIKYARERFEDPDVIMVSPQLEIRIHSYLEKIQKKWFYGTRSRYRTSHGTGSAIQFVRKKIFDQIKYDPTIGFGDDSDFRRRLNKRYLGSGKKVVFSEESKIYANLPHTFSELTSQYQWYGRTAFNYFKRYHSFDAFVRLGSLLLPTLTLLSFIFSTQKIFYYFTIIGFFTLLIRNLIICIRTKSIHIIEFLTFDFVRSILFVIGLLKSPFFDYAGR
jgi:glycosyltransferase involved in cell wall biosynthesis